MDKDYILHDLQEILRDIFDDPDLIVTMETTADDVEHWDSANQILVLVACEQKFSLKFDTSEMEGLRNVGELVNMIHQKTT